MQANPPELDQLAAQYTPYESAPYVPLGRSARAAAKAADKDQVLVATGAPLGVLAALDSAAIEVPKSVRPPPPPPTQYRTAHHDAENAPPHQSAGDGAGDRRAKRGAGRNAHRTPLATLDPQEVADRRRRWPLY